MKNKFLEIPFQEINDKHIGFRILDIKELLKTTSFCNYIETHHRIKFNSIIIIMEGEGLHNIDFKTYSYKKGTILFVSKNQITSFKLNPNINCCIIEFTDEFICGIIKNSILDMFDYMRYSPLLQLDKITLEAIQSNIKLLISQLKFSNDEYQKAIIQSLFQSLLFQLKRERVKYEGPIKTKDDDVYSEFLKIIRTTHKYSMHVEDYSRALNISSKTLSRILTKYTNKTTKRYLNEFLLLEIKRYLLDEDFTLQRISNRLEFDDPSNLIKFFKRFERITPSEFKRLNS